MRRSLLLLAALAAAPQLARAEEDSGALNPFVDLETGWLWASRNDVGVPGDGGTRFSLAGDDFAAGSAPFVRLQGGLALGRHRLSATFAPLRLSGNGRSQGTIVFRDQAFTADGQARATYRFDTYRLTYRYALVERPTLELALGATALVRDAEIKLSRLGQSTAERNLGLVPLLSFRLAWRFAGPVALAVDGDALAAPQGRAEDVLLALEFGTGDLVFRAGYRVLEGGADNSTVYSFAWLNHASVGVRYRY